MTHPTPTWLHGPKTKRLGVYSCHTTLVRLDKRTRQGRLMRGVRNQLIQHVGGKPNVAQRMLIERAVLLSLRIVQLDQKIIDGHDFTEIDNNSYLAWSHSLARMLNALGLETLSDDKPSDPMEAIRQHIARRQDEQNEVAA